MFSAAPRATLTPLSCSLNFPRAQYLDIRTLTHELIVTDLSFDNIDVAQSLFIEISRPHGKNILVVLVTGHLIRELVTLCQKTMNYYRKSVERKNVFSWLISIWILLTCNITKTLENFLMLCIQICFSPC